VSVGVFIVEDEAIIAMEIEDHLRAMGYDVRGRAARAEQALERIPATKPDVVLVDVNLGSGMSGVELTERLRDVCDAAVIYLTAYSDRAIVERAIRTRSFAYLVKPFQREALRANIEMAVHLRDVERASARAAAVLRATLDATADGLFVVDAAGDIVDTSRTLIESWQIPSDAVGTPAMLEHMARAIRGAEPVPPSSLATEVAPGKQCIIERTDGRVFERRSRTLVLGSEILGRVVSLHDVTEQRHRARLEVEARYRAELFEELNHRIKNNLQGVVSLLRLRLDEVDDPRVREILAGTAGRVQAIAMVHEHLSLSGAREVVAASRYFDALARAVARAHAAAPGTVTVGRVEDLPLRPTAFMSLGMIAAELLVNALRHAFVGRAEGRVMLELVRSGDDGVLVVSDDGVGVDGSPSSRPSMGMRIVRALAEGLGGRFERVSSPAGTRASVTFPLRSAEGQSAGEGPT
jgi:two-component sensor histidine kinase/DNA-binding NarL/FixJ family response regulator